MAQIGFWRYWGRVLARSGADAMKHFVATAAAIVVAIIVSVLQARYQIITPDQTWTRAMINSAALCLVLVAYLLFYVICAPWKMYAEQETKRATDVGVVRDELEPRIRELEDISTNLQRQLEVPSLVVEIVRYELQEIQHTPPMSLDSVFSMRKLVGLDDSDTVIRILVILRNLNRVPTTAERYRLELTPRLGTPEGYDPEPGAPLGALHPKVRVEYGIPQEGWLQFRLKDRAERNIVAGTFSLMVQDGVGNTRQSAHQLIN